MNLNALEVNSRLERIFMDGIVQFHTQNASFISATFDGKIHNEKLNMYALHRCLKEYGGIEQVKTPTVNYRLFGRLIIIAFALLL